MRTACCCYRQPFNRIVVEAEIEEFVHHARHRRTRARTDGDEKRVRSITEASTDFGFKIAESALHAVGKIIGLAATAGIKRRTNFGRQGEARRHRKPEARHLGESTSPAAKKIVQGVTAIRATAAKSVDPFRHRELSLNLRKVGGRVERIAYLRQ